MARDGTARGGPRVGAGKKRKALSDCIVEGKASVCERINEVDDPSDLDAADMPPVSEYMLQSQKNGGSLKAKDVFMDTWIYLKKVRCEKIVSRQLLEQYAMSVARWVQCETAISDYGFIAKHPTTGAAIASPYVAMSREYVKQINQCWYQIYTIVRDNSTENYQGATPQDDLMERLLSR